MNQLKLIFERFKIDLEVSAITGLTDQLDKANETQLVFYNLQPAGVEKFKERLAKSNAKLVFVNHSIKEKIENVKCLDPDELNDLKEQLLEYFFDISKVKTKLVAITGTNGKTSVSYIVGRYLHQLGYKVLMIGTLGIISGDGKTQEDLGLTTPSQIDMYRLVSKHADYDYIVLEASSHALEQNRFGALQFEIGAWTSFSQDHLDYHKTMESYFQAKLKIFKRSRLGVVASRSMYEVLKSNPTASKLIAASALREELISRLPPEMSIDFNLENVEVSLSLINALVGESHSDYHFEFLELPPGRLQSRAYEGRYIFVDYAHTPDAIESVTRSLRKRFPSCELSIVFGCGGNRDRTKRPLMRVAAEKYADRIIITSDNPRDEDPEEIIRQVKGESSHQTIIDRREAIRIGIEGMKPSGVLVIAGKGHETYQEIKGIKYDFSDVEVCDEVIRSMGNV
jgi:UDP-N-acetylmuramoyl-L-alanyl-D-glutamate--2,6-diaminopimelate ligase